VDAGSGVDVKNGPDGVGRYCDESLIALSKLSSDRDFQQTSYGQDFQLNSNSLMNHKERSILFCSRPQGDVVV
jgi:hypothetical protein